jgi:DNA polymerase III sliding clamp (beta) subunit (PCNA family)
MIDVLRSFEDEEIIIYMNTDSKPIVIMSASDDSLVQLILPIKTF